ncbi:MAG: hypothetical protein GX868_14665 [Actinobacteria bacterium]|nr:hypothetical protein [Actinomycetota bacterium]
MWTSIEPLFSVVIALIPVAFVIGLGLAVIALIRRLSSSAGTATPGSPGARQVIVLPRPNPLERHRLDPIAFVAGGLTVAVGIIGLLHQAGAFDLGPGAVAVTVTGLIGVGVVAAVLLWPRQPQRIEDPRLERRVDQPDSTNQRDGADQRDNVDSPLS